MQIKDSNGHVYIAISQILGLYNHGRSKERIDSLLSDLYHNICFIRLLVTRQLGLLQRDRPWTAITVKTRQATTSTLNIMTLDANQLKEEGTLLLFSLLSTIAVEFNRVIEGTAEILVNTPILFSLG